MKEINNITLKQIILWVTKVKDAEIQNNPFFAISGLIY